MTTENLTVVIHNAETGEIIEREMNAAELKQAEKDKATYQAEIAAAEAKATAKAAAQAKLAALGLTVEDLQALGL
jgi:multidrug efflux pump subunit AcrA (membrane-fusion protein)